MSSLCSRGWAAANFSPRHHNSGWFQCRIWHTRRCMCVLASHTSRRGIVCCNDNWARAITKRKCQKYYHLKNRNIPSLSNFPLHNGCQVVLKMTPTSLIHQFKQAFVSAFGETFAYWFLAGWPQDILGSYFKNGIHVGAVYCMPSKTGAFTHAANEQHWQHFQSDCIWLAHHRHSWDLWAMCTVQKVSLGVIGTSASLSRSAYPWVQGRI